MVHLREFRCLNYSCQRLLGKIDGKGCVEISCPRCKAINTYDSIGKKTKYQMPEKHNKGSGIKSTIDNLNKSQYHRTSSSGVRFLD